MDFQVIGQCGKVITSTKVVIVSLKCSAHSSSQDKGRHLQTHQECLYDCWKTIQSIKQQLQAQLLHFHLLPPDLGEPPFASQWKDYIHQWNGGDQMSHELQSCSDCQICFLDTTMQMMRTMIHWTWAVQRANLQSAGKKLNSRWSNLPKR